MYEKFLPAFHAVEINLSLGHRIGHAISQDPVDGVADLVTTVKNGKNSYNFLENGKVLGYNKDAHLEAYKEGRPFLLYNDELPTGPFDSLDQYAQYVEDTSKPVYTRAIALYEGDTFTTDNVVGTDGNPITSETTINYVTVGDKGQLQVTVAPAEGKPNFKAKKCYMPNNEDIAVQLIYTGIIPVAATGKNGD